MSAYHHSMHEHYLRDEKSLKNLWDRRKLSSRLISVKWNPILRNEKKEENRGNVFCFATQLYICFQIDWNDYFEQTARRLFYCVSPRSLSWMNFPFCLLHTSIDSRKQRNKLFLSSTVAKKEREGEMVGWWAEGENLKNIFVAHGEVSADIIA